MFLRNPRTLNERAQTATMLHDLDLSCVKIRSRRRPGNLPTDWDDICKSNAGDRCWKRYRLTQWR